MSALKRPASAPSPIGPVPATRPVTVWLEPEEEAVWSWTVSPAGVPNVSGYTVRRRPRSLHDIMEALVALPDAVRDKVGFQKSP